MRGLTAHEQRFMERLPEPDRHGFRLFKSLNPDSLWTNMTPEQRNEWCVRATGETSKELPAVQRLTAALRGLPEKEER